jgi:hypothetical protein
MTFPTVQKGVEFLVGLGILREATGQQRNRLYVAPEIMAVMRGDRLKAVEEGENA